MVLTSPKTPVKAKRGIPHWFRGKVSPAFASHIFWPSPPKKPAGQRRKNTIFPACASTHTWRELYNQTKNTKNMEVKQKQPRRRKDSPKKHLSSSAAEPTDNAIAAPSEESSIIPGSSRPKPAKRRSSTEPKSVRKEKSRKEQDTTPCLFCEVAYCNSAVDWFQCHRCKKWCCGNCSRPGPGKKRFSCGLC